MTAERARDFERELEVSVEAVARMRKRGIRLLPGGDLGFPATPHGTYARDLWIFVKILGFSAMETLVAATRLGGALMGRPDELGVVKAGALADLLLVVGDPLADIVILQDRGAFRMVMKDGALHKDSSGGDGGRRPLYCAEAAPGALTSRMTRFMKSVVGPQVRTRSSWCW